MKIKKSSKVRIQFAQNGSQIVTKAKQNKQFQNFYWIVTQLKQFNKNGQVNVGQPKFS